MYACQGLDAKSFVRGLQINLQGNRASANARPPLASVRSGVVRAISWNLEASQRRSLGISKQHEPRPL